jgi:multisubunit Na+/H+ antiporter MnhG subunit
VGAADVIASILLWAGIAGALLCCLGILVMRGPHDRLHYLSAVNTLPAVLVVAAVVLELGMSVATIKAALAGAILVVAGPVLTHSIARSVRIREWGTVAMREEPR